MQTLTSKQAEAMSALSYLAGGRGPLNAHIDRLTVELKRQPTVREVLKDIQTEPRSEKEPA